MESGEIRSGSRSKRSKVASESESEKEDGGMGLYDESGVIVVETLRGLVGKTKNAVDESAKEKGIANGFGSSSTWGGGGHIGLNSQLQSMIR